VPSYYRVSPKFWTDPALRGCSDDARLLALYLLTGPHRRLEGLFRLPKPYICADLGWSAERLAEPFVELLAIGFLRYDETAQVALVVNALKYQAPENDNQVTAALKQLDELPDTPLTSDFQRLAGRYCERLAKRLPERFGKPIPEPPAPAPAPAGVQGSPKGSPLKQPQASPTGRASRSTASPATVAVIPTAQTFVAAYVDAYRGRAGHDPPSRVKGQVAKHLGEAFADDIPADTIKAGFVAWFDANQHPATIPSFIEVAGRGGRARASPTRPQQQRQQLLETDQVLSQWANGGDHGPTRVADDRRQAQRELPRPGAAP
jgi:hypothetical protein